MLQRSGIILITIFFALFIPLYSFAFVPVHISRPNRKAFSCHMLNSQYFQPSFLLTSATVEEALAAAEKCANANGFKVTIAICDAGGVPLIVKRQDGAFPASVKVAIGKAETAAQFNKPTAQLEAGVNVVDGSSRAALLSAPFVLMRGGLPIVIHGVCCGAIGVSGVKPDEDELVAQAAVDAIASLISKL